MSFYIDVLLPFPLKNFYTYRISKEEFKFIKSGFRVFGVDIKEEGQPIIDLSKINFEALAKRFKDSKYKKT